MLQLAAVGDDFMDGIRVLIVDDSLFFRKGVERELSSRLPKGSRFELAVGAYDARDKILSFDPDVMVLDAEMPNMDGIEFLRRLMSQYTQPTIVLSEQKGQRFSALSAGAMDFMEKPDKKLPGTAFYQELARRVAGVAGIELKGASQEKTAIRLIAMGASTGGTEALSTVLRALRAPLPPVVIVQHIPPMFSKLFAERLEQECSLTVKEAEDGDTIMENTVYIAPGSHQMRVHRIGGIIQLSCTKEPKVGGHCPAVNVLFDSVAKQFGEDSLGVILTGMGADGSTGLLKMRHAGARTLGQDEASCVVYGMPKAAYDIGAVERQLPLNSIASAMMRIAGGKE